MWLPRALKNVRTLKALLTTAETDSRQRHPAPYGLRMLMPIMRAPVSVRGRWLLPGANTT